MFVYVMTGQHLKSRAVCFWPLSQQRFRAECGRDVGETVSSVCLECFFGKLCNNHHYGNVCVMIFHVYTFSEGYNEIVNLCVHSSKAVKPKHVGVPLRLARSFRITSIINF